MAAVKDKDDDSAPVFSRAGIPPDTAPATPTRDLTSEDFNNEESYQSVLVIRNMLAKDPELKKRPCPTKRTQYPISWNRILGQIVYPLQVKYINHIK